MKKEQIIRIMKKEYSEDCKDCKNDKEIIAKFKYLHQRFPNY